LKLRPLGAIEMIMTVVVVVVVDVDDDDDDDDVFVAILRRLIQQVNF